MRSSKTWLRVGQRAVAPLLALTLLAVACAPATSTAPPTTAPAAPAATKPAAPAAAASPAASPAAIAAASPVASPAAAQPSPSAQPAAAGAPSNLQPIQATAIWTAVTGANGPLWTAYEEGYFKQEGLDLQITHIPSTSRAIAAMLAGQAQFGNTDPTSAVEADVKGGDITIVVALTNRLVFSVMAQPDITGPQDLKGKKLGITRAGSSTDTAARQALDIWHLQPETDVALVPLTEVPAILAGLQAKQVDAGVVSPPTSFRAIQAGFKELINLAKDGPEYPSVAISTRKSIIQSNPEMVRRFVRGYARGLQTFKTDKAKAEADMNKYLQVSDQTVLDQTWQAFSQYLADPPYVPDAGMQKVIADAAQTDPQAKSTKPSDYVDPSFVKSAVDQGMFKQS